MAYAVEVTLGTGNKVSLNYQSQEVNVSITYQLEREDTDVLAVVREKAEELVVAHALAWKRVKEGVKPKATQAHQAETGDSEVSEEENLEPSEQGATLAQAQLIRSLSLQAGLSEGELKNRIQAACGGETPEELSYSQATILVIELGREERNRFERERTYLSKGDELNKEETQFLNSP